MSTRLESLLAGESPGGVFAWRGHWSRDLAADVRAAGWQFRRIDSRATREPQDVYDRIVAAWGLPSWFGRNLDALWDVLGELVESSVLIEWVGLSDLAADDPEFTQQLLGLLMDATTQAPTLSVVVRDAPGYADTVSGLGLGLSDLDALL